VKRGWQRADAFDLVMFVDDARGGFVVVAWPVPSYPSSGAA
jgi:hypothetical protein